MKDSVRCGLRSQEELWVSSVSANYGASTKRSSANSSSRARTATSFQAPALTEPATTVYAVDNAIDECPECAGKPWSEEFLEAKDEIEGPDEMLLPF